MKSVIYEEAAWLERHRIAAYVVLYVQFLQMVLAFNVHPRVEMLTSTIQTPGRTRSCFCLFEAESFLVKSF